MVGLSENVSNESSGYQCTIHGHVSCSSPQRCLEEGWKSVNGKFTLSLHIIICTGILKEIDSDR